jgi:hypothetical protein
MWMPRALRSVISRTRTREVADVKTPASPYRRSMNPATHHQPTNREILAELLDRIERVDAAAETVKSMSENHGASATMLTDGLHALEHHLALAVREAAQARERIRP